MIKSYMDTLVQGETLECPVCKKQYKVNSDTLYIIKGGYTCSWNCFLKVIKEKSQQKESYSTENVNKPLFSVTKAVEEAPVKRKRGRPPKIREENK